MGRRQDIRPAVRAQLLYEDAVRIAAVDSTRGDARLRAVAALEESGNYGERARLLLIRHRLSRARVTADLVPAVKELDERVAARGPASGEAGQLRQLVARVLTAADSASAGAAQADLRLFLAAETARDSLAAAVLAASLFRTLVESMPDSPYAPKAILAGRALDPAWGESVLPLLEERYALSPYVALVRGEVPYGYQELEDSLQSFALGIRSIGTPQPQRPKLREDSIAAARRGAAPPPRRGLEP